MVTAEPTLSFDIDVTADNRNWTRRGNHAIWCGSRGRDDPPYVLHEWTERGVRPFPRRDDNPVLHRVPAGTPYHIAGLFGFWVVNDVDTMLLSAKRDETTYYMLVAGGLTDGLREAACLFVCPKCAARFFEEKFAFRGDYESFVAFVLKRVRAFNADPALRACPKCGHVHPATYGFHADADTPDECAARDLG
jgi:hypothetical protein